MKILLSTGSLHNLPFEKIFSIAKKFEFSGVELHLKTPSQLFNISKEKLEKLSIKHQIPILSIHSPPYENFLFQFLIKRDKILFKTWKNTLELAKYLNSEVVVIHPFPFLLRKEKTKFDFENLLSKIKNSNIKICIENMPKLVFFSPHILITPEEFKNFCSKNNCFQTLDTTHSKTENIEPADFFRINKDYIKNIHISDYKNGRQHLPPGKGEINFKKLFENLKKANYQGFITLELIPKNISSFEIIKNCKEYIQTLWENS
jgi:sugar phosphate isomerase/epimerase